MMAAASSTSNHIWSLSPTIENMASSGDNSEDKASLLHLGSGCSKSELIDSPDMPNAFLTQAHFGKMPLEDRTKYEKLCSNDEITSDDSDDENVRIGSSVISALVLQNHGLSDHKKTIFKQIANTNYMIHEKLHAVGQKVNKKQVKAPIVRKLITTKSKISGSVRRKDDSEKKQKPSDGTQEREQDDQDDDSIGSASDLRAEAEDDFDEQDDSRPQNALKRVRNTMPDDGISQSVKTCGSSVYHAECESVATNEDDVSRVVVKVLTKKRERPSDAGDTILDQNQLSPSSADFLHKYGDKPLLLDDELDYHSDENTESKEDTAEGQSSEELDVFAMAPFKMPKALPKKLRTAARRPPKFEPPITPIVEDPTLFAFSTPDAVKDSFWTSTPKKGPEDHQHVFATYLTQATADNTLIRDEFNEPIFNPILNQHEPLNSSIDIKATTASANVPIDSQCNEIIANLQKDMFDSEPFPQVHVPNSSETARRDISESNNNQVKAERFVERQPQKKLVSLVAVNQPSDLNNIMVNASTAKNLGNDIASSSQTIPKYINFSKPDNMLPLADSDYVIMPTTTDDEETQVFPSASRTSNSIATAATSKSSKKDKSAGKYSYLKEKSTSKASKEDAAVRVGLPSILSAKVKGNSSLSYKKVKRHSKNEDEEEDDGCYFQSNSLTKSNAKAGFNNMSFEDFPSDQELDCLNPSDGANRTKTTPFEVVRNEKMLLEAEKKFGSLKRRTNLFSS